MFGFFFLFLTFICSFTLFSIAEEVFHFGSTVRGIFFYVGLLLNFGVGILFVLRPFLKITGAVHTKTEEEISEHIGNFFPQIKDKLHNAIQLVREREKSLYSPELIDASLFDVYAIIEPLDFLSSVDTTRLKSIRKKFTYAFAGAAILVLISPVNFYSAFNRVLDYSHNYNSQSKFIFHVEPGNKEIVRGESVPVKVTLEQSGISLPNFSSTTLTLFKRQQGQAKYETQTLKADRNGAFITEFSLIKNSLWYYAEFENEKSGEFSISVLDKPIVRSFHLKLTPPRYTKLPEKELEENSGDVSAYKGTKISLHLTSSKELKTGTIQFSDSSSLPMNVKGKQADIAFPLIAEKQYHVELEDENSLRNDNPITYRLAIIPDEFPTATIVIPGKNIDADESMQLDMQLQLKDDFGFSKLRLAHKLVHSKYEPPQEEFIFEELDIPSLFNRVMDFSYRWNFMSLQLAPEDIVQYYLEVFDNDNVSGPKSGKSQTYLLRLPSLEEVFADANKNQNDVMQSLSSASQEANQLRKELEKLNQEMKKRPEKLDWLQKKKAEELAKKYQDVKQKVENASQQLDEMMKQTEQNQLLSPQTMQKYDELQKLMKELDSPEFRELLKKMAEQQKPLSPEDMKEAMKNLSFNEEQFRKALERMMELMKRLAMEQKLDELLKRTEEAIKQQKDLKEKTEKSPKEKSDELSKKQSDVQKQTDKLEQESKELAEKMKEFSDEMPVEQMEKANEKMEKNNPQLQMQKSQQQMKSGQMAEASQSQQNAQQSLEQFMQDLKDAQKEMRSKQQEQVAKEMQKQIENALKLSQEQEQMKNESQQLEYQSPRFREQMQQQNELLNDVQSVANALANLGKKTFAISPEMGKALGDAMKQMGSAMEGLENRNGQISAQQQTQAMSSLNRAAAIMQNALNAMQKGGGGGGGMQGMMQSLGQSAEAQGGINEGTQGAMGGGKGGMTQEQAAAMSRLAQQQSQLGKSMSELANEASQTEELSKLLGDLENIAKEMQEVATDMEQGNVNPATLQKQERILSRLLDSQRSMRERDYEKRRQAEQGKNVTRISPSELDLNSLEGKNQLQQDLLKALREKYSKDYETLIRKYFEALQKAEERPQ